jgi:DNA (cytosine-5)-methyltransferase 1
MKIGSLCTGYGGLDIAVEAVFNAKTVWTSEIDKYASALIKERFCVPNYGDLKTINWNKVEPIDILTAGYPCQPFSNAGYRKGTDDERHIFPYILEAISILRPRYAIMENVRGHISLGFKEVLKGLAEVGYDAKWRIVRASDVGAPHRRERLFIIAYPKSGGAGSESFGISQENSGISCCDCKDLQHSHTTGERCSLVRNNKRPQGNQGQSQSIFVELVKAIYTQAVPPTLDQGKLNPVFVEYMMGLPKGWVTDLGFSRAQQLKMLGNGVVPQQAQYAIHQLLKCDTLS